MYIILSCGFVVKHEVVRDDARTEEGRASRALQRGSPVRSESGANGVLIG